MPEQTVIVWKFSVPTEAELAKNQLEAEGIAAFLEGDLATGLFPMVGAFGGINLRVRESDAERARKILAWDEDEEEDFGEDGEESSSPDTRISPVLGRGPRGRRRRPNVLDVVATTDITKVPNVCPKCGTPMESFMTACPACGMQVSERAIMRDAQFKAERLAEDEQEEGVDPLTWTADELARRAFRAAILGPLTGFLLTIYSAWLLIKLASTKDELSPAGTWRFYGAAAVNIAVCAAVGLLCLFARLQWIWSHRRDMW